MGTQEGVVDHWDEHVEQVDFGVWRVSDLWKIGELAQGAHGAHHSSFAAVCSVSFEWWVVCRCGMTVGRIREVGDGRSEGWVKFIVYRYRVKRGEAAGRRGSGEWRIVAPAASPLR